MYGDDFWRVLQWIWYAVLCLAVYGLFRLISDLLS